MFRSINVQTRLTMWKLIKQQLSDAASFLVRIIQCGILLFPTALFFRLNIYERLNQNLPSFDRINWVDRRHLDIRFLTMEDQGVYQCEGDVGSWSVQLTSTGI